MPLTITPLPFGLRDVKLYALDAAEAPGTAVDLPAARTFTFQESEDFEELRGDDALKATHGNGPILNWSLEAGGISLEAAKVLMGGLITESGTTPNQLKTLAKLGTDSRPYFQVKGQIISDSGGDVHAVVYKCKAEGDVGGDFAEGSFFLTGASGRGLPKADNKLWDIIQHETAIAIS